MRHVTNRRTTPNATLQLQNYRFALKNWRNKADAAAAAPPLVRGGKFASWLGEKLGSGAYGVAFRTTYGRELFSVLTALTHTITARRGMPRFGTAVVVKLSVYDIKTPYERWLHGCIRETAVHKLASDLPPLRLKGIADVDAARHVPALYVGGLFEDPYTGAAIFVTCMAVAPGVSLQSWLTKHALDAPTYLKIERAAVSLWLNGIVHADLHPQNVMFDGKSVTIIDFGFAVVLSETQTDRLQALIVKALRTSANLELNSETLQHVDGVQAGRGAPFYHDDGSLLANLRKKVHVDAGTLNAERRRRWGTKASRTIMSIFKRST